MKETNPTEPVPAPGRRALTRDAVVARALEIGTAEGLEAVTLRRLAQELGVTPMALYRHVRDKQDLINAMTEVVLEGMDVTAGVQPGMTWTERLRLEIENYKAQIDARPLALPLSIAYNAEGPPSFWRVLERLLAILLEAGFARREAIVLIRMISNLLAGYLLLLQQGMPADALPPDPRQLDLMRRGFALAQMRLPRDEFPNLVESAEDTAEVWLTDPNDWWGYTVDLITFGMERMLERSRERSRPEEGAS
ncbi:MAG: TetR family transcriptional regulator [Chloroflexi bacterium]|nr:TetR family transcriptional regulator [Chloroflexota bacterium]